MDLLDYYKESWNDIMYLGFEDFLFRLNELSLIRKREQKDLEKMKKKK
jgi:hypothetical protein